MRLRFTAAIAVAALVAVACTSAPEHPKVRFDDGVPPDLAELASETWDAFTEVFRARWSCIPDVTVGGAWQLGSRAAYHPDEAKVEVRVPATAAQLATALVHEFAHHVEFTCPEHADLRPAFLRAQGLPADADWFDGSVWETTPSELYAEATIEVVLGSRTIHRSVPISQAARDVIAAWAGGTG